MNLIKMITLTLISMCLMPIIREGAREADRLLEEHKGAEAEAKKLKAGMESSVSDLYFGRLHFLWFTR